MNVICNEVLVSYDIEDNKQRKKLHNELKDLGLLAIQKSVFWGHLNKAEESAVRRLFKQYCREGDKAFVARIKLAAQIKLNSFGYSPEEIPLKPVDYYVV